MKHHFINENSSYRPNPTLNFLEVTQSILDYPTEFGQFLRDTNSNMRTVLQKIS